jgi:glycosyltransferase involved in cell wall biosynthesis
MLWSGFADAYGSMVREGVTDGPPNGVPDRPGPIGTLPRVSHEAPRTRYVFVVTALAAGGTLSVMREFWLRLEGRGSIEVISHGPESVEVGPPVTVTGRGRFGGPLRFPAIWLYAWRTFLAARRAAGRPAAAMLLPQDSLATGAATALAGRLSGRPVVLMEHGTAVAAASDYFWRERLSTPRLRDRVLKPALRASVWLLHRLCLRLVDRILVAGDESERQLRRLGVPAGRIARYHFPVDLDRFRPADAARRSAARARWGLDPTATWVASVSRLAPEKGVDVIVEALARIAPDDRPGLVVAGDGPMRPALESLARERGVAAHFVGALGASEVVELLAAADLFVYAGRQGANTPYAVLEAMAAGLAVAASTEPAVHAVMLAEDRGIAIAPDDPDAMAAAIARLASSPAVRADFGRRAREYVEQHHAPEVLDRELDTILGGLE